MTTHYGVVGRGFHEANPLMDAGISTFGPPFIYGMKGTFTYRSWSRFKRRDDIAREQVAVILALAGWAPALNNLAQLYDSLH